MFLWQRDYIAALVRDAVRYLNDALVRAQRHGPLFTA